MKRSRSLIMPADVIGAMLDLAGTGYPEETCGVLVGRDDNGVRQVERMEPVGNQRTDERRRRYLIDADALRRIEAEAAASGLDVIGFYHSHPDHPAVPSAFDREHAWPWYSYVIVPVMAGEAGALRAWRLQDDRDAFIEETISVDSTDARKESA